MLSRLEKIMRRRAEPSVNPWAVRGGGCASVAHGILLSSCLPPIQPAEANGAFPRVSSSQKNILTHI